MYDEYTVTETYRAEIIVEKSRFIAYIFPLVTSSDAEKAADILKRLKKEYYDSSHICYAYITDESVKFSDDSEPQDTAGKPILEILKSAHLKNVMIAVIRYFGGIKLGTGGLSRAYSEAAASAVKIAEVCPVIPVIFYKTKVSYKIYPAIKNVLQKINATVVAENFGENVVTEFAVNHDLQDKVFIIIAEATLGTADITELSRGKMVIKEKRWGKL